MTGQAGRREADMPTTRRRRARGRTVALTSPRRFEFLIGPTRGRSAFPDDDTRRQAWADHRDEFLDRGPGKRGIYGSRPWAWWKFESPVPRNQGYQVIQLFEMGELEGRELESVLAEWRRVEVAARAFATSSSGDQVRAQWYWSLRESGRVPKTFEVWDAVSDA